MITIKYCEKCKQAFDIATNFSWCPDCRILNEVNEDGNSKDIEEQRN